MYIHTYTSTYIYIHTHTHTHTYTSIQTYTCMHTHTHTHTHTHRHTHTHVSIYKLNKKTERKININGGENIYLLISSTDAFQQDCLRYEITKIYTQTNFL